MNQWKISAGTACVLGKKIIKSDVLPTTAYIMLGEKCRNNCHFCAQSQGSAAKNHFLSRVTWPAFDADEVTASLSAAYARGDIKRICLQVVNSKDSWENTIHSLDKLGKDESKPICVSSFFEHVSQAKELIAAGAEKVCIALDGATPDIYGEAKGGNWEQRWSLLIECAAALPDKITTHLIVGLGETEEEMVNRIAECLKRGIDVGLFAFTPISGTAWAHRMPPSIGHYRRVQIAYQVLQKGYEVNVIQYSKGRITAYNVPDLHRMLADGKAFETRGCPDCNRPFYNESPRGVMYNYPRTLTMPEVEQAIQESVL
jgi:biotin synthase-related radical SAM superfamily protein